MMADRRWDAPRFSRADQLTWLAVAILSIHNFWAYDPLLGYDGDRHLFLIRYVSDHWQMPAGPVYGSSNPPLYYWVAAALYRVFPSTKAVQGLSFLLWLANVAIFRRLAREYARGSCALNLATLFYAFLPLTIEYGVMVFNYTLANFLSVASLFLIHRLLGGRRVTLVVVILFSGLAIANVFTSLTGIAAFITSAIVLGLLVDCPRRARWGYLAVFAILSAAALLPFARYRTERLGCVFCTSHRLSAERDPKLRDYLTYVEFSAAEFERPFFENGPPVSVASGVYSTFFSDYFNYLVPERLSMKASPGSALISTGRHFVDAQRILQFRGQLLLGGLLSLGFLAALLSLLRSGKWGELHLPSWRVRAAYLIFGLLTVLQFLAYVYRYPNGVNFHAGYLYPLAMLGALCLVRYLATGTRMAVAMQSVVAVYTALNTWTFWL